MRASSMQKGGIFLLLVLVVLGVGAAFLHESFLYGVLNQWKLIPEPERFTELYFNDYTAFAEGLPTTIRQGDTVSFAFTIHNVEGKMVTYPYVIYMVGDNGYGTTTVASKSVTLDDGASITIPVSYTFGSAHPPSSTTMFVTLVAQQQSLHFFIPNKN